MTRRSIAAVAALAVGALLVSAAPVSAMAADVPTPTPTATVETTATPSPASPAPSATTASPTATPSPSAPAPRATSAPSARVAAAASTPTVARVSGSDRYATSVAASRATFPNGSATVLISSGASPIDGVIAAGMAAHLDAPLLYVTNATVPAAVMTELRRLAPSRIVVIGGTTVLPDSVLAQLRTVTSGVERFGGANRYETSRLALAEQGAVGAVYVSSGAALIDAPLAAVAAASTGRGALLVNGLVAPVDAATVTALRAAGAGTVVIVGGTGTVSAAYETSLRSAGFTVQRRVASDRYSESVTMTAERTTAASRAIVANVGRDPDVAVAASIAAVTRQPLYYAIRQCIPDVVSADIAARSIAVTAVGGDQVLEAATLTNSRCTSVKNTRIAALTSAIKATMKQYAGSYSVSVRELSGLVEQVSIGGSTRQEPASMMKLFAAWAAFTLIDQKKATLNTILPSGVAVDTCIRVMINVSDNYCHTDLVHWIGIARLNSMIHAAGFTSTSYGNVPKGTSVLYAGNRTTTNDLTRLVEALQKHTILSAYLSDIELHYMQTQIWRSRIASGIPPGITQGSKPGALWVASGLLQGDTAIVYGPKSTYVLSIIGVDNPPQAALRAISRTVYSHFNGSFGTAASYPTQQMATKTATVLRSTPGGAAVVSLPAGVNLQVLDGNRIWYQVQYGSRKLWVLFNTLRNR